MTLQELSPGSAADGSGGANGEQEHQSRGVGFRFRNGYDFGAAAGEALCESASREARAASAVEADAVEIGIEAGSICEDDMAVVETITNRSAVFIDTIPVPDGQVGAGCPRAYTAEAQRADEAGEVDDRVGAEGEKPYAFVEGSTYCHTASTEIDSGGVIDGVLCCDEEGASVDIDDRAVGEGASSCGLECAAVDRGGAVECCRSGEGLGATAIFHEVAGSGNAAAVGGA